MLQLLLQVLAATLLNYHPRVVNKPFRVEHVRDSSDNIVVLHYDSGYSAASTLRYLRHKGNAYHYFIERSGVIVKMIDPRWEGRHAGLSYYHGKIRLNRYSIGICLQGNGVVAFSDEEYLSLAWLLKRLQDRYPDIDTTKIVGHSDIAFPRGRKADPGPIFDWFRLRALLR